MLPRIDTADGELGFRWAFPDGRPARLVDLLALPGAEPERWLPTHLEALDDVLIDIAARFGDVLGGGRSVTADERADAEKAYRVIDRACHDYAVARAAADLAWTVRAGQIIGTAALLSIRLRAVLGVIGSAPFDGELDQPTPGAVGGQAGLIWVDDAAPARGARWVVTTTDGRRLPATLSMLLFDSSGVFKDATLDEHRAALTRVSSAVAEAVDPFEASGAIDWLLFDWVMAHRDGPDSGAVEIKSARVDDARMLVEATAASLVVRSRFDPALLQVVNTHS